MYTALTIKVDPKTLSKLQEIAELINRAPTGLSHSELHRHAELTQEVAPYLHASLAVSARATQPAKLEVVNG
jgi:predicted transcriptional regulator